MHFFFSFLKNHCYLETLQLLGHIASRVFGWIPEGFVFLLLYIQCFIKFTDLILQYSIWIWWIMIKWIMVIKIQPSKFALIIEENHEKTTVRLVGTGIWTRDLLNASFVHLPWSHLAWCYKHCSLTQYKSGTYLQGWTNGTKFPPESKKK